MRYYEIGKIINTHGIRGNVKVYPTTDDVSRFGLLKSVFVAGDGLTEYGVDGVKYMGRFVLMKLTGIDTANAAERLKGSVLKVKACDALPLGADEYYVGDIYGLEVHTEEGEHIGPVTDILFTGANDVYVVKDSRSKSGVLMIPAVKECVLGIDTEKNTMLIRLMEGLRELK